MKPLYISLIPLVVALLWNIDQSANAMSAKACSETALQCDPMDVSILPRRCREKLKSVKKEITRAELEKSFYADGGIFIPFGAERYVLDDCQSNTVIKILVQFKPSGMSEADYIGKHWTILLQRSPNDTVWSFTAPYRQEPMD